MWLCEDKGEFKRPLRVTISPLGICGSPVCGCRLSTQLSQPAIISMVKDEEPLREIDRDHGMLLIVQGFFDQPTSAAGISKTKVKQAVKQLEVS